MDIGKSNKADNDKGTHMNKSIAIFVGTLLVMGLLLGSMMYATPPEIVVMKQKTGDLPSKTPWQPAPDPGIVVRLEKDVVADDLFFSQLRNLPINQDRLNYYAALSVHERMRIAGWDYTVMKIETRGDSIVATVRVNPLVRPRRGGSPGFVDYVIEEYELKNGNLVYVKKVGESKLKYEIWN